MASLKDALEPDVVKKMGVIELRKKYNDLALTYNKIVNRELLYCPNCDEFHTAYAFYPDKRYKSGLYPECKQSLLEQATDYDKSTKTYIDNREKTIEVFKKLDLPFIDSLYRGALTTTQVESGDRAKETAFQHVLTMLRSLPQYRKRTFATSEFGLEGNPGKVDINENSRTLKTARKRFGSEYTNEALVWLENEYQDWITRYECNSKAQEDLFERLSLNKFERKEAVRDGKSTKEIDKTFQELLATNNITPRQTSMDTMADAQTFGTLIQKYEETRPLPEIDPELADVDKVGLYIDAFFRGHTSKMLGLKNAFSHIYERFMKQYTVNKPEYNEDEDSEALFEKVFGSVEE